MKAPDSTELFFSVGIVNDPCFIAHLVGFGHPEASRRSDLIVEYLKSEGLLTKKNSISPKLASNQELNLAHSLDYIHLVEEESAACSGFEVKMLSTGDAMISARSFEVARYAVGAVITAIDSVMNQTFSSAFCIVRPPGHHASASVGMGFCLFNNVVIGALYALKNYPIKRVLIVDWDLHHGNGTEDLVKSNPDIFYFSTHQSPLWPGTGQASEKGCGNIHNIEIAEGRSSRAALLQAYAETLPKLMETFQPELIIISAGFDAHENDPLGNLNLKSEDFGLLTHYVKKIADHYAKGRIISVLEGGYNLQALVESASFHVKSLIRFPG